MSVKITKTVSKSGKRTMVTTALKRPSRGLAAPRRPTLAGRKRLSRSVSFGMSHSSKSFSMYGSPGAVTATSTKNLRTGKSAVQRERSFLLVASQASIIGKTKRPATASPKRAVVASVGDMMLRIAARCAPSGTSCRPTSCHVNGPSTPPQSCAVPWNTKNQTVRPKTTPTIFSHSSAVGSGKSHMNFPAWLQPNAARPPGQVQMGGPHSLSQQAAWLCAEDIVGEAPSLKCMAPPFTKHPNGSSSSLTSWAAL
mmetsp:Transcript_19032/g.44332  ORF Transcript_19032/g.44332 Transcript_19032/m.44332 type:complete len:254 (-) Transcript_19032:222-983(-)